MSFTWSAIGTTNTVIVTRPDAIVPAAQIARRMLDELDAAASRFRPDSELSRINTAAREGDVRTTISPTLARAVTAALRAAALTDGLVDPTVGGAMLDAGYDTDIATVRSRPDDHAAHTAAGRATVDWRSIDHRPRTRGLSVPRGAVIDLGAIAKADAADAIAAALARRLPGGFLVNLGGDIATSGRPPAGGWSIAVDDDHGRTLQTVDGDRHAFATSSTRRRRWTRGGRELHHIIDPRTGEPGEAVWAQVTCAAATALEANAASTAAVVLGHDAPEWLADRGIPGRLDPVDGPVVATPGWPLPIGAAA